MRYNMDLSRLNFIKLKLARTRSSFIIHVCKLISQAQPHPNLIINC